MKSKKRIDCGRDSLWDIHRRSFTTKASRYLLMMEDLFNVTYYIHPDPIWYESCEKISSLHAHSLCQDARYQVEFECPDFIEGDNHCWVSFHLVGK